MEWKEYISEIDDTSGNTYTPEAECKCICEYEADGPHDIMWWLGNIILPDGKAIEVDMSGWDLYEKFEENYRDRAIAEAEARWEERTGR